MIKHPITAHTDSDEDEDDDEVVPFKIFTAEHVIREYNIYLSAHIDKPHLYDDVCQLLRNAAPHDVIRMYINTHGGNLSAGLAMIQAMAECEAEVITILNPEAYSMGALLFLAGDQLVAPPPSILMFHDYSSGAFGKGNEQVAAIQAANGWFRETMHRICHPFLSHKEIDAIADGKDLWLHGDALQKRLRDLEKTRAREAAQAQAPRRRGRQARGEAPVAAEGVVSAPAA